MRSCWPCSPPRACTAGPWCGSTHPSAWTTTSDACVVDAATDVGRAIARIFTGFLTREFGEKAFKVERIAAAPPVSPVMSATGAA